MMTLKSTFPWLSMARRVPRLVPVTLIALGISSVAQGGEWQTLFDGKDLSAWKTYGTPADAPIAWVVENGVLAWRKGCGNLATRETFRDFELELEWKISPGGNSG